MKRWIVGWTMVALLLAGSGSVCADVLIVSHAESEFTSIQAAVDQAAPGDTIVVRSGLYTENVLIEKPLTLVGGGDVTLVPGMEQQAVLHVYEVEGVAISGFEIRAAFVGIRVYQSRCDIGNCIIQASDAGISISLTDSVLQVGLYGNDIHGSGVGIRIVGNGQVTIADGSLEDNVTGVVIGGIGETILANCRVIDCFEGIVAAQSTHIVLASTSIHGIESGIRMDQPPLAGFAGSLTLIDSSIIGCQKWAMTFSSSSANDGSEVVVSIRGVGNSIISGDAGLVYPTDLALPDGFFATD